MLLVFLILPINMVFVILIQPFLWKGEEFLGILKYQYKDVSLVQNGIYLCGKLGIGFSGAHEVKEHLLDKP
jgi:hypothetical protein